MSGAPYEIGVQSFTYREFDVPSLCAELQDTDVTAIELCDVHVTPSTATDAVETIKGTLADAGLDICGYGVVGFEDDDESYIREMFGFVDRLGAEYCSLEFPPADEDIRDTLLSVADEFDLDLAIHNHGPGATYSTLEDVTGVLEGVSDRRLGACVDTGHFLRSDEDPVRVVDALGDRVLAVHLKDFVDTETEAIPGDGRLDIPAFLDSLDEQTAFERPLVIEYEADPEDPTPAVEAAATAVQSAWER